MYKVKVWNSFLGVVIQDGKSVRRKCYRGEDVYLKELSLEDVENGLYIPYRNQIVGKDGNPIEQRKRVEPEKVKIPEPIEKEIKSVTEEFVSPNGIPDKFCIEEGQDIIEPFSQEDYVNQQNQMHNSITNAMYEGLNEDQQVIKVSIPKSKMPVFAEANPLPPIILGTLNVADQSKMPGKKDIFDNSPIIVDVVKNDKGEIDVVKSLGLKLVGAGDTL